ncbi:glycerate 2-kinase [Candidatus Moduliflexus flocculans]|uniref:Glycerate 2-kinase n=1 Tax=Candidatus Moduliflexus flocculans TaxID=1499966 RepID=A0A0S6VXH6_9BACT|nr:glycerate 2-kinase [Candidatus Moduliflexus flocculans]
MNELLRQHAREIFAAGLRAVDPIAAIQRHVRRDGAVLTVGSTRYDLHAYRHIYVIGGGKAGASMAQAIEEILGDRITAGWVNVKYAHLAPTHIIALHEAGHPVPDREGAHGVRQMIAMIGQATAEDLVICLISGGGSALLPAPAEGISLEEKQAVTSLLLRCGATIHEMNAIRKHISAIKGGQLARIVAPATMISLILSDVIGDPLDTIASGPTVPDTFTFADCLSMFERFHLLEQLPRSVRDHVMRGARGEIAETPKPGDPLFDRTQNLIIASNIQAAQAAADQARSLGYHALILSSSIAGETRVVANVHAAILKEIVQSGNPLPRPACIVSGGETTVTIQGNGLGGRNQEFALSAALDIAGLPGVVVLSAGTDGTDGPTDAAGAVADGETVTRAKRQGLEPGAFLTNNDSYHFFDALGDLVKTGPTHTNVMDLRILLANAA